MVRVQLISIPGSIFKGYFINLVLKGDSKLKASESEM